MTPSKEQQLKAQEAFKRASERISKILHTSFKPEEIELLVYYTTDGMRYRAKARRIEPNMPAPTAGEALTALCERFEEGVLL